jgi:lipopolysaccharide export system permease protein
MQLRIHDRYLLKQYLRIILFSVLAFVVIYVTVDVFEEIDNFIDHEARFIDIAWYYVYSVPFILTYIIPVSLLLGTVFSLGVMSRRNELTALIASGISLIRVTIPIMITALLISVGSAYFNDVVVSHANRRNTDIMLYKIEKRTPPPPGLKENLHYLGAEGYVYLARTYNHRVKTLYDVVIQQFDGNTLMRRIDARKMEWEIEEDDRSWTLSEGVERSFRLGEETVQPFDTMTMPDVPETPEDFGKKEVKQDNMTFAELRHYIEKVRLSGGDVGRYMVDLYFKLSFPLAGSIFVLIGIAFASGKRKPTIATGFGVTLLIAFMYYGVLRVGQTLGHNGVIPPLLAAQLGNIIFLGIGLLSLTRANR